MSSSLLALEIVGKLSKIPIDSRAIVKEYAIDDTELSIEELTRIVKKEGFKASIKKYLLKN